MPYPVPPSRLYPPRTAREVFRVRPLRLLEEAFRKSPGVVLAAGAGYGKTSLAAELPAVYVSLAEEAKDPAVFLWHLLAAYENRAELAPVGALLEAGAWPKALEALLEEADPGAETLPFESRVPESVPEETSAPRRSPTGEFSHEDIVSRAEAQEALFPDAFGGEAEEEEKKTRS